MDCLAGEVSATDEFTAAADEELAVADILAVIPSSEAWSMKLDGAVPEMPMGTPVAKPLSGVDASELTAVASEFACPSVHEVEVFAGYA